MTEDFIKLAWAAGILDGESHFGAHGKKTRIAMSVTQFNDSPDSPPEMLTRLKNIFEFGAIYYLGARPSPRSPHAHMWEYRTWTYDTVHAVLRGVWPYLGRVKRKQAVLALKKYRAARRSPVSR